MSEVTHVDPYTLSLDETIDENVWEEAQRHFDSIESYPLNDEIEFHTTALFVLKERKQKIVRAFYDQMLKEKEGG